MAAKSLYIYLVVLMVQRPLLLVLVYDMKKSIFLFIALLFFVSCEQSQNSKRKVEDYAGLNSSSLEKIRIGYRRKIIYAKQDADNILNSIGKGTAYHYFTEANLDKESLQDLLIALKENCQFDDREGNFVDFIHIKAKDKHQHVIVFVYEFYLKCDDTRVVISYDITDIIKLVGFKVFKLSDPFPFKVDSTKQLKLRGLKA